MNKNTEIMFRHVLRDLEEIIAITSGGMVMGDFDEKTGSAVFDILVDAKWAIEDLREKKEEEE